MTRFDARIRADFPAFLSQFKGETERLVKVVEMSLGGLLLEGAIEPGADTFLIRVPFRKGDDITLYGEIVRRDGSRTAVQFFVPDRETMTKLWSFIHNKITVCTSCPYCKTPITENTTYCCKCGWYLDFRDPEYIDKHLDLTFMQRIAYRMGSLTSDQRHRVLNYIDKDLLLRKGKAVDEQFVGTSDTMRNVFAMIRKIAPTENAVLLLGESGTGKELAARAIHERSNRRTKPFVVINCAAIPEPLLEAELFGYEKGAFTGAYAPKKGKFEIAHTGTIFLDEIGEMPLSMQAKFLRVLESESVERLGSRADIKVSVRVIASTNRELTQEVSGGKFRLDLFHRINTFTITLPPLRDRGEDKVILAKYYLKKFCSAEGTTKRLGKEAMEAISSYSWPGNVRELMNKIRRAIVVSDGEMIAPADLSIDGPQQGNSLCLHETMASVEKQKLAEALSMNSYNITKASRQLGISRPTMYCLIKKYDIRIPETK